MGKPSIFSSEYEKKMKKRRRNMLIFSLLIILAIGGISAKLIYDPINFSKIKQNLQAWVDSDTSTPSKQQEDNKEGTKEQKEEEKNKAEEKKSEPEEKSIDIKLCSGKTAKAIYVRSDNNTIQFTEVKDLDPNVTYDISPSKNEIVVCDTDGTMSLYNIDGSSSIISKDQYVSSQGTAFLRTDTLNNNPNYLWNVNAKFIDDSRVVFITNRPYFGMDALTQYLWITDIPSGSDNVLWNIKGSSIQLGESSDGKIPASIDGITYHIDANGNYSN